MFTLGSTFGSFYINKRNNLYWRTCGMSVFTATTMYDFVAGRQKLFRAGCACWMPGGAFCVAVSWLAGGRNWSPEKGRRVSPFRWRLGALKRAVAFFFSFSRAAGWTLGEALCVAASWLAWLGVLQYSRAAVFFAAATQCRGSSLLP
jgi:hypothetical protein